MTERVESQAQVEQRLAAIAALLARLVVKEEQMAAS